MWVGNGGDHGRRRVLSVLAELMGAVVQAGAVGVGCDDDEVWEDGSAHPLKVAEVVPQLLHDSPVAAYGGSPVEPYRDALLFGDAPYQGTDDLAMGVVFDE